MFDFRAVKDKIFGNRLNAQEIGDENEVEVQEVSESEDMYQRTTAATGTDDNVVNINSYRADPRYSSQNYSTSYSLGYGGSSSSYVSSKPKVSKAKIEICRPVDVNDASAIIDKIKENVIVVVNLSDITKDGFKQRICDFLSGASRYGSAKMELIEGNIFVIAPKNATIEMSDLKSRIGR